MERVEGKEGYCTGCALPGTASCAGACEYAVWVWLCWGWRCECQNIVVAVARELMYNSAVCSTTHSLSWTILVGLLETHPCAKSHVHDVDEVRYSTVA